MGFMDGLKAEKAGRAAYKAHVAAVQLRKKKEYAASQERFKEALALYDEAYALGCRTGRFLQTYAVIMMRFGLFEKSKPVLEEAFRLPGITSDEKFDVRIDYAICLWKLGDLEKAIASIERAAQVQQNSTLYSTMGMFLIEQARLTEDFDKLHAFNEKAMDYDDEDAGILDNMGQTYLAMSDVAAAHGDTAAAAAHRATALEYERKAHAAQKDQVTGAYFLALLLHEQGKDAEAREALDAIGQLPISATSQIDRAMVDGLYAQLG